MKISSSIEDKYSIIRFEVDQILGYEAQEFQDAVVKSFEQKVNCIIVDLSSVKFISSWGIGMLIHGLVTTRNNGSDFKVVCSADSVFQVFKTCKLDSVLEIYESIDIAKSKR